MMICCFTSVLLISGFKINSFLKKNPGEIIFWAQLFGDNYVYNYERKRLVLHRKMKDMKDIVLIIAVSLFSLTHVSAGGLATEKENPSPVDMDVSVVSQHLWRGTAKGAAPAVKPGVKVNIFEGLSVAGGAVYSMDQSYDEVDLSMSYKISDIQISLSDYYSPDERGYEATRIFNYDEESTDHYVDLELDYQPFQHTPIGFKMATALWGNRFNQYGENRYSTYLETNYQFKQPDYLLDFFFGVSPGNSLYSEKFNVVNMGMTFQKMFEYSNEKSFPIAASIVGNPAQKQLHVSFALSFL